MATDTQPFSRTPSAEPDSETPPCATCELSLIRDDDLLRRTGDLTGRSRRTEATLLAYLGEIDARRLYLREACSSIFAYCTERLHFSGGEAFLRIAAARATREHPVIFTCWQTDGCT